MANVQWEDELTCYTEEYYFVQYFCNMRSTFGIVRLEECWCKVELDVDNADIHFIPFCMCVSHFQGPYISILL